MACLALQNGASPVEQAFQNGKAALKLGGAACSMEPVRQRRFRLEISWESKVPPPKLPPQ